MPDEIAVRDPRVDPKVGDVLKYETLTRTVVSRALYSVTWTRAVRSEKCGLAIWRKWAKYAEVVHAAE